MELFRVHWEWQLIPRVDYEAIHVYEECVFDGPSSLGVAVFSTRSHVKNIFDSSSAVSSVRSESVSGTQ